MYIGLLKVSQIACLIFVILQIRLCIKGKVWLCISRVIHNNYGKKILHNFSFIIYYWINIKMYTIHVWIALQNDQSYIKETTWLDSDILLIESHSGLDSPSWWCVWNGEMYSKWLSDKGSLKGRWWFRGSATKSTEGRDRRRRGSRGLPWHRRPWGSCLPSRSGEPGTRRWLRIQLWI